MPSIGFTLSKLREGLDPASAELKKKWQINKELYDSFFGFDYPLSVYKCLDEAEAGEVLTASPFAEQGEHLQEFAQSEEMEDYLDEFGDIMELRGAFHIERDWEDMPAKTNYVTLGRHFVREEDVPKFEVAFAKFLEQLPPGASRYCSGWTVKGGWRDQVQGDDSDRLASFSRGGLLAEWRAGAEWHGGEGEDDDTRQYVNFFAWEDLKFRDETLGDMEKDIGERPPIWQYVADFVQYTQQNIFRNYVRVDYANEDTGPNGTS